MQVIKAVHQHLPATYNDHVHALTGTVTANIDDACKQLLHFICSHPLLQLMLFNSTTLATLTLLATCCRYVLRLSSSDLQGTQRRGMPCAQHAGQGKGVRNGGGRQGRRKNCVDMPATPAAWTDTLWALGALHCLGRRANIRCSGGKQGSVGLQLCLLPRLRTLNLLASGSSLVHTLKGMGMVHL